jgi:hypothetical protein
MREFRPYGSVEGVMSNHDFYSDYKFGMSTSAPIGSSRRKINSASVGSSFVLLFAKCLRFSL